LTVAFGIDNRYRYNSPAQDRIGIKEKFQHVFDEPELEKARDSIENLQISADQFAKKENEYYKETPEK
jgi:hypothetical protein